MNHVRIKRSNQTIFVYAEPKDLIETIKLRCLSMRGDKTQPENIRLIYEGIIMESSFPLSKYTMTDSSVLHEVHFVGT